MCVHVFIVLVGGGGGGGDNEGMLPESLNTTIPVKSC